ncbi:MAG: hypothetical protein ACC631_09750 [Halocynthiibacter sp.]
MELLIGLISGAIGGNIAGRLVKKLGSGIWINSVSGLVGGGLGSVTFTRFFPVDNAFAAAAGGPDFSAVVNHIAAGAVGGGIVLVIVGALKNILSR